MNDDANHVSQVSASQLREAHQIATRVARLATKNGDLEFIEQLLNILVAKEIQRFTACGPNPREANGANPLDTNRINDT
jgi:hypothetical protein